MRLQKLVGHLRPGPDTILVTGAPQFLDLASHNARRPRAVPSPTCPRIHDCRILTRHLHAKLLGLSFDRVFRSDYDRDITAPHPHHIRLVLGALPKVLGALPKQRRNRALGRRDVAAQRGTVFVRAPRRRLQPMRRCLQLAAEIRPHRAGPRPGLLTGQPPCASNSRVLATPERSRCPGGANAPTAFAGCRLNSLAACRASSPNDQQQKRRISTPPPGTERR
jgi:hypothetical protein